MKSNLFKYFFIVVMLVLFANTSTYAQSNDINKKKTEYVIEFLKEFKIGKLLVITQTEIKEYRDEWLLNVTREGDVLIFKNGDKTNIWDLKNAIYIQRFRDVIKIHISEHIKY